MSYAFGSLASRGGSGDGSGFHDPTDAEMAAYLEESGFWDNDRMLAAQDLMNAIRPGAIPQSMNPSGAGEFSGQLFVGVIGGSISGGVVYDGQWCTVYTSCVQLGLGAFIGGGPQGSVAVSGPLKSGVQDQESFGAFASGGKVVGGGGSMNFGRGQFGKARGFGGVGMGGAAGLQLCRTTTTCN